ncbi:ubiquitin-protein transferase activity protein [Lithohypha guttulata]|uniref:Ubiquitin-protein transferase activity protein n=1 Tax=Lithohypha guttulata TaxID=1690604 RepID=A0ABR0KF31_9EURO|nr:ubiquitin-protein transferase activity protein [Lithohypha guttulata]
MDIPTYSVPNRLLQTIGHIKSRTATCGICTEEMTPQCGRFLHIDCHVSYHRDCLAIWIDTPGNTCPNCRRHMANNSLIDQLDSIETFAVDAASDMDKAVTKIVTSAITDLKSSTELDKRSMVERARTELGGDPRSVDYWASRAANKIVLGEVEYQRRPGYVAQQRYFEACLAAEERYHQGCVRASPRLALRSQELDRWLFGLLCVERYITQSKFRSHVFEMERAMKNNSMLEPTFKGHTKPYNLDDFTKLRQEFHAGKAGLIQVRLSSRRKYRKELIAAAEEEETDYNRDMDAARARLDEAKDNVGVSGQPWEPDPPDPRDVCRTSISISKRTTTAASHTQLPKKEQGAVQIKKLKEELASVKL